MKIYRGNVGIELTLEEFSDIVTDDECLEGLLDTIYELEQDEVMNYSEADIQRFEENIYMEVSQKLKENKTNLEIARMVRTLSRLKKYEN